MDGKATEKEQDWSDIGSLFQSAVCSSRTSEHSRKYPVKQEVAAEVAVSQAILKVLEEQEIEQMETERLEAEVRRKQSKRP